MQQHMHDLVGQGRADVPAVGSEAVVQLDEVLRARGEFDARRVLHLAEAHDHPGVRQAQMLDQGAGDALRAEMQVVLVGEGHVARQHARRVGAHALGREPSVQRGDRGPHGVEVRIAVHDLAVFRHHVPYPCTTVGPTQLYGEPTANLTGGDGRKLRLVER